LIFDLPISITCQTIDWLAVGVKSKIGNQKSEMSYVDLFAEMVRSGVRPLHGPERRIRGFRSRAPREEEENGKAQKHGKGKRPKRQVM
jgi:hypothetical protein